MKLHFIFASLIIVAVLITRCAERSYATHPSEVYRRIMLTKTPIPKTVSADFVEEKHIYVGVGKGGVIVDTQKPGGSGISVDIGKGGVIVDTGKPGGSGTSVGVAKGGVSVDTHQGGSNTRTKPGPEPGVPVGTSSPTN